MQYSMLDVTNASAERQLANDFPTIRFMTVAAVRQSQTPLREVLVTSQKWSVSSNTSVASGNQPNAEFGYFSAVCFFFGRRVSEALSPVGDVPIGLLDSSWGGTNIECWSPFLENCGCGGCFHGMISPFTTGPLPIKGVAWYQVCLHCRNLTPAQSNVSFDADKAAAFGTGRIERRRHERHSLIRQQVPRHD